ncbi:MAG: hypothetical protein J7K77_04760 [Dehalococcoidales bacterium]|nr:hypothetical protein [Dehalococcoidales bacterium]
MKRTKIFQILTLTAALSLFIMAIPAAPALAAESINLSPSSGEIDESVTITGAGFNDTKIAATIYFSSNDADVGDEIDDEVTAYELIRTRTISPSGTISYTFHVPSALTDGDDEEDVIGGDYFVYVTYEGEDEIQAVEDFTVRGITLSDEEGPVGSEVGITAIGFTKNKYFDIEYAGDDLDSDYIVHSEGQTSRYDGKTDRHGEIAEGDCIISIPESVAGEHTIVVKDRSNKEASAIFFVIPQVTTDVTSGVVGDSIAITGTGFGSSLEVAITFNNVAVASDETDSNGGFSTIFTVPDVSDGSYNIKAKDEDNNHATVEFTVETSITASISPATSQASPGHVGSHIMVTGTGFGDWESVTIKYDNIAIATAIVDANGAINTTFDIPASQAGNHVISIADADGTNIVTAGSFVMESAAPAVPELLSPEDDGQAEALASFDWGSVSDPSGVTYTLQVANKDSFSSSSILLEKTGLADSEYTITREADALEPTEENKPYYWRVKAIDGTSSESDWSTAGSFYIATVAPGHGLPGKSSKLIHLWWGLGATAAGFIGYYVGKKRSYYY